MNISGETKVKDIALANPGAKRILEQAGLDYCCGGGKSLHDACMSAGVAAEEILLRLRENQEETSPEDSNWLAAPLSDLTRHIREKHHQYIRSEVPRVRALLEKVKGAHGAKHPEIERAERGFQDLGRELTMHMQKEEQILFPYIEALERAASGKEQLEAPFFQTVRNPVHMMMKEHDDAGELLRLLREECCNYQAPADACESYKELYRSLEAFEQDLHTHIHLENNILFPRAVELEEKVG